MRKGLVRDSEEIVKKELQEANKAFRAFESTHEGYARTSFANVPSGRCTVVAGITLLK